MKGRDRLRVHITKETIQHFVQVRYLLYFSAHVIAIYLSIDNVIKDSKLAVSDINKGKWKNFATKRKAGFFIKYSCE